MYPQNFSLLTNKKHSFNSSLPNNIAFMRNFSSQSYPKYDSLRTAGIMDFVYSLNNSSRLKLKETLSNRVVSTEKSKHGSKQLISLHNSVVQMPVISSHLVGGFVGSKSQLGRRPTHGFGVNMWDIIQELIGILLDKSANSGEKGNIVKNSLTKKNCTIVEQMNCKENDFYLRKKLKMNNQNSKLKDPHNSKKHSYADVTKNKLRLTKTEDIPFVKSDDQENSLKGYNQILGHLSACCESDNRKRIASECSLDSEDSFIVFEYCEGDDMSIVGDDCSTSEDESVADFQIGLGPKEEEYHKDENLVKPLNSSKDHKLTKKKVQFAKNLTKVHHMVTWDYAHRDARKGPWEMLARDSERFRGRIANTETILSPILDPAFREAVFQKRFADLDSGN